MVESIVIQLLVGAVELIVFVGILGGVVLLAGSGRRWLDRRRGRGPHDENGED